MALIEIGSTKQLFVDDYLIESLANSRRVLNPAVKVEHNPIIRPERPWEGNHIRTHNVVFDERDRVFKMVYSGQTIAAHRGQGEIVVEGSEETDVGSTCLATSSDGISWERPNLGLVEFQGSKRNNIIPKRSVMDYSFQDLHEEDPARRYKGHVRTGTTQTPGMKFDLYFSPDGFDWTPYDNNPIIDTAPRIGRWGPTSFMGWDPIRRKYAAHMENCLHRRCPLSKRVIGRAESPDGIHWSDPETILVPDQHDSPDTEFYAMRVVAYEGIYVGMLRIFRTTNTTHHPEAVFSRNGIHYQRDYREPFIARGASADFDSTSIFFTSQIVHEGRILTYYFARNWRSPETLLALGDRATEAIGLAVTPLDGFVSLDGVKGRESSYQPRDAVPYSQMVTRSFGFTGSRLYLNLQAALQQWGAGPCEVRIQLLSPNHEPLDGYGFDDCDPITMSGQAHVVSWNGNPDVSGFEGKPIKLRFYFKNAKLFSFQFR